MDIAKILPVDHVFTDIKARSEKLVLQELSQRACASTKLDMYAILDVLLAREHLGSTGIGGGIGLPHGKIEGLKELTAFFTRLEDAVNFDADDGKPVDLVFLILAPNHAESVHLRALSAVARLLQRPEIAKDLRAAPDAAACHKILTAPPLT